MVKVKTADIHNLIADIKKQWDGYNTGLPFSYSFLDQQFAHLYSSEEHVGAIFTTFSVIAVIIACLGLFGLAAFMIRQRVKEIGIRKVLGASSSGLATLLSKDFVILVIISCVIAFPVSWLIVNSWLKDYEYKTNISWWIFVATDIVAIGIAIGTVSFQAVKVALTNPVKSLRSE